MLNVKKLILIIMMFFSFSVVAQEYNPKHLYFVTMKKGHEDIFNRTEVDDYWLSFEDIEDGYNFYYVIIDRRVDALKCVKAWRKLPFVDFVESNSGW